MQPFKQFLTPRLRTLAGPLFHPWAEPGNLLVHGMGNAERQRPEPAVKGEGLGAETVDLDADGKPDVMLHDGPPGPDVSEDADSVNIDFDHDGEADVVIEKP